MRSIYGDQEAAIREYVVLRYVDNPKRDKSRKKGDLLGIPI